MAPGLGADFTKLWSASAVSHIGDGMTMAAGPLLVASLTDDPAPVAGAVFVQQLPWLLFSLFSGVVVDRLDRRRLAVAANLGRGAVMGALAVAVGVGQASIPVVYACLFLLGVGATIAEPAAAALVPAVVPDEHLPRANSRMMSTQILGGRLAAPPVGAALFAVAAALPFGLDAASFVLAALLVAALRDVPGKRSPVERRTVRAEMGEGLGWLARHEVLRTVALCLCLMNTTLTGAMSIMVLYATGRLGLDGRWFGLLLGTIAVGGLLGTLVSTRLIGRVGPTVLLRVGLLIELGTHLVLALTREAWVAGAALAVFGLHSVVWNVIMRSVQQREVPDDLRGRVGGALMLLVVGGSAVGALIGGALAGEVGITSPFWLGVVVMAGVTVVAWRPFAKVAGPDRPATTTT